MVILPADQGLDELAFRCICFYEHEPFCRRRKMDGEVFFVLEIDFGPCFQFNVLGFTGISQSFTPLGQIFSRSGQTFPASGHIPSASGLKFSSSNHGTLLFDSLLSGCLHDNSQEDDDWKEADDQSGNRKSLIAPVTSQAYDAED